jgi:hypothetical protein
MFANRGAPEWVRVAQLGNRWLRAKDHPITVEIMESRMRDERKPIATSTVREWTEMTGKLITVYHIL